MRRLLLSSAAALAVFQAGQVQAEAADADTATVEQIIVTGEKANRSLQDTVSSVAVVTSRRIEQEAVFSLAELYGKIANVSATYGTSGFTIRGIANQGVTSGGDADLVTVYVDGSPLPTTILSSGPTDAWDMSQIEILRGPQSTLQGLNALAGTIVMRSQDPTFHWDARGRALVAENNETGFALAGGGPLIADQLAFRISAEKRDSDGVVHNVTRDAPEDPLDTLVLRGKLLWTPAAAPGLTARLGYTHSTTDNGYAFTYTRTDVPDFYDHRTARSDYPNASRSDINIANLELTYDISDKLSLTSASSWSDVAFRDTYDGDATEVANTFGSSSRDFQTITQEVRLAYKDERVKGLLGAFFYDRRQQVSSISRTDVATPVTTISGGLQQAGFPAATAQQIAQLYAQALPVISVDFTSAAPIRIRTYALFGDGEFKLTGKLSVIGGFRWDREKNRTANVQATEFRGTYPDPAAFANPGTPLFAAIGAINGLVAGQVGQANAAPPIATRAFNAFLPKAGVRYEWTSDISTAFVVQRGYRSGGSSINTARAAMYAYDPEYTWNYEASFRSAWLDGALTLNANAYYITWKDQQVSVNFGQNTFDYHTVNAGKSHLYGFEVEATHQVTSTFDVYGSVGYSRTKFDEFVTGVGGATEDLSGSEFAYAPRWTLSAGLNYRWGSGFVVNANANYRTKVYTSTGSEQNLSQVGGRTLVNGRIGYETEHWGIYAFGKNILDEHYMSYNRGVTDEAVLGDPRVLGAMVQARW